MELTCRQCSATYRIGVEQPLRQPVRVACPKCGKQVVLRPAAGSAEAAAPAISPAEAPAAARRARRRHAVIADEDRPFRAFLAEELTKLGFETSLFETGDPALARVKETRAELVILNVYLKGKLGVEISEEIKADDSLKQTKVVLIGALFRANRFRANPTNLYGADEYIEEMIPARELEQLVRKLFPDAGRPATDEAPEPKEYDEARRLARLILSDIIIYNAERVDEGIRHGTFFDLLSEQIEDGRKYYESRVPHRVRQWTEFYDETLQQFVRMKQEELQKLDAKSGSR